MEHRIDNDYYDEDDALSLKNLQMYDQTATSSTRSSPRTSSAQELFEFFPTVSGTDHSTLHKATGDIMFCGKLIPGLVDEELNGQYHYRNGVVGSTSFRLPNRPIENVVPLRSVSNRDFGSPCQVKKVNVTALASKSRRRRFICAPVNFMPEMEMRSIRERQGRLAPSRMFPAVDGGDARKAVTVTHKNTVSCRTRLNSVFERSLACLRPTM